MASTSGESKSKTEASTAVPSSSSDQTRSSSTPTGPSSSSQQPPPQPSLEEDGSTSCSSPGDDGPHGKPGPPPVFYYTDGNGVDHSISIASPEEYEEACRLEDAGDWDALAKFPPGPPLKMIYPDSMSYQDRDGMLKTIYIPPDEDGKNAKRATELFTREDWETLEREFEPWDEEKHPKVIEEYCMAEGDKEKQIGIPATGGRETGERGRRRNDSDTGT
ncbi:hypothetical protein M432DRAFT_599704 [Thermoascus aurantiacus ATCC 26904]